MKFNRSEYRKISNDEVDAWGRIHFGDWLVRMQDQHNSPKTSVEKVFRCYTQGTSHVYNNLLRYNTNHEGSYDNDYYDLTKAIAEFEKSSSPENIIVFRYIDKPMIRLMKKWSGTSFIKKNSTIWDKALLSTTLTPETVQDNKYCRRSTKVLKIYVPKGTPCIYLELIADMNENEMLFPPSTKLRVITHTIFRRTIECEIVK